MIILREGTYTLMKKKYIVIAIIAALILFLIPYAVPLILAFVTAVVLEPLVQYIHSKFKLKRIYAVTITFFLYLIILAFLSYISITVIVEQLIMFVKNIPFFIASFDISRIESLMVKWENFAERLPIEMVESVESAVISLKALLIDIAKRTTEGLFTILSSIPEFLFQFLVYVIAVFLFSSELPKIYQKINQSLEKKTKMKVTILLSQLNKVLVGFLKAQIILSGVTFALAYIGLILLDSSYPVVLSLLIVLVDLLPILGTGSFIVPWAIYCYINGDGATAIGLIILFLVITVVRRVIEPKIFSTNLGISALAALVSMYIGFQLLGFIGLLAGPGLILLYDALVKADIIKNRFTFVKS
jgi:sporulation integral membrane protein YtvI